MNHDLVRALEKLTACGAELARRTLALKEANDRLAAFLARETRLAADGNRYPVDPAHPLRFTVQGTHEAQPARPAFAVTR
jgi:hypothetical protein